VEDFTERREERRARLFKDVVVDKLLNDERLFIAVVWINVVVPTKDRSLAST
jgi:hypothetical protein